MGIWRTFSGGGRFELMLNINPLIVLTRVGGSVRDLGGPDVITTFDGSGLLNPVGAIGGQWSTISPRTRSFTDERFSPGGFYAATDRALHVPVSVQLTSGGLGATRLVQCAVHME
jgi:hypothetical protein